MWQMLHMLLTHSVFWASDELAQRTGWAAVRVPLARARGPNEKTLLLPGYVQTTSYGCGGVAAAMAVRCLWPEVAFGTVYDAVDPLPQTGTGTRRLIAGLRILGVRVRVRKTLTFSGLARAIQRGSPVLLSVHNPGAGASHWVAVYGYALRPDFVYLASNGLPWFSKNRITRAQLESIWAPKGNGLICEPGRRVRLARSRNKPGAK